MPGASASRRSRLMVLRLRADERLQELVEASRSRAFSQWNCWSVRCRKPCADQRLTFGFRQEGEVHRGGLVPAAELDQAGDQAVAHLVGVGPGRTSSRRPVAGVNGTDTWSLG